MVFLPFFLVIVYAFHNYILSTTCPSHLVLFIHFHNCLCLFTQGMLLFLLWISIMHKPFKHDFVKGFHTHDTRWQSWFTWDNYNPHNIVLVFLGEKQYPCQLCTFAKKFPMVEIPQHFNQCCPILPFGESL
jgi:hypothetical protein